MNGFFWAKRYLFKQKRRTFLTAFGIALAIALVCGTCVLADSFRMMMVNAQVLASGDWHYDVSGIDSWEDARTLIANRAFESGAVYSNDLYARFSGAGRVSEQNYGTEAPSTDYFLRIYEGDSDYVAMSSIEYNMQAGRLPESADEIALSVSARRKFENAPSLGDTITLPVGALDYQEDSYNSDDDTYTFTQTGTRTYTVVGFVDVTTRPLRAFFAFSLPDGGAHSLTARVKLRSLTSDYRAAVENAVKQAGTETVARAMEFSRNANEVLDGIMSSWENRNTSQDIISQKQSDATLGYERICDTETGEIYKAENGWSDGYHGDRYQLVSEDSMYLEPISGYIE